MVVHIELHLRDDAAEIGHQPAEHPRLVHPAQHGFGIARGREHIEEERIGARFAADVVDELGVTGGGAHRERVDFEPVEVGKLEQLDEARSEEHTSELQSLMRISYAVFCLKKKKTGDTKYN